MRLLETFTNHLGPRVETLLFGLLPFSVLTLNSGLFVILYMVDAQCPFQYSCAVEIINSEYGRPLVFIHEEPKAFSFPRFLVTREIDINDFTISKTIKKVKRYMTN
jgi:hypothetical protein